MIPKPKRLPSLTVVDKRLTAFALTLPGAYEEFPWNERVVKVNKKIFVFIGILPAPWNVFRVGVKLPDSAGDALMFPFAEVMGYNLGKSGWVGLKFAPGAMVPEDMLKTWIVESYRAVAPKKLVAQLDDE